MEMNCPSLLHPSMHPQVSPQKRGRKDICCFKGDLIKLAQQISKYSVQELCKHKEIDIAGSNFSYSPVLIPLSIAIETGFPCVSTIYEKEGRGGELIQGRCLLKHGCSFKEIC